MRQIPASSTDGMKVSVIVPVYNAMPYLVELLDSLVDQDIDSRIYSVILVNDGSTDDGPDVIDSYAAKHPNFHAIHQRNSGWAGGPRNIGLANSESEYVFFADSDDIVTRSALRKMVEYADQHQSDIVIPQMTGFAGRAVSAALYAKSRRNTDLVTAFRTLGPIKLYRRKMLDDHGIRFPEAKVRLEDGIFNAYAYLNARRISILCGEDYYLVRARDDGQNISVRALDPEGYTWSVAEISRIVNASSIPNETKSRIVLGLYQRKCLKIYVPERFAKYTRKRRQEWLTAHRKYIAEFISEEMEQRLAHPFQLRSRLVRLGDERHLLANQGLEMQPLVKARLQNAEWKKNDLMVNIDVTFEGHLAVPQLVCELRRRDAKGVSAFPLIQGKEATASGIRANYHGALAQQSIHMLRQATYDIHVAFFLGKKHVSGRVEVPLGAITPDPRLGLETYRTEHGNMSLKIAARTSSELTPIDARGAKLRQRVRQLLQRLP